MKLIIEHDRGLYAYFESEDQFQRTERTGQRLDPKILDNDCCLGSLPQHSYIVIDVAEPMECLHRHLKPVVKELRNIHKLLQKKL